MSLPLLRSSAAALGACVALLLAGCTGGLRSSTEAPIVYSLRVAAPPVAGSGVAYAGILEVLRPVTAPGLDSDRLVVTREEDRSIDVYANARWAARVPRLLESLAVDTLRDAGVARVVQDDAAATPADVELRLSVRRFDAAYAGRARAPVVHVALDAVLSRRRDRVVLAAFSVERKAEARADRLRDVVLAFEQATQPALAELVDQVRTALR